MSFLLLLTITLFVFLITYNPSYKNQVKLIKDFNKKISNLISFSSYKVPNRFKIKENTLSGLIATCDPTDCPIYNHRDALSKCSLLCDKKFPNSIFTGNYTKSKNLNSCECRFIENLSNTDDVSVGAK